VTKTSLSRRTFLGASLALGLGGLLLYIGDSKDAGIKLYSNNVQVLLHSAYHLFPHSTLGPSAKELNIATYLSFVLNDERILKEDRESFLQGALWLEESAFEMYDKSFLNLTELQKEELMQSVSTQRWGEYFIYTSLGYIFEALLSAPVYGSNINEIGWKWLEHNPGFPQPMSKKDINYAI
jgi:gluconate 2-dehydrogenase gamma chain